MNSGVCIKASDDSEDDSYYYGYIKDIIQLEYMGEPTKELVLFNCDWFDPTPNQGVNVDSKNGIVEVCHRRRYPSYDPFIFAQNVIQVYYTPYLKNVKHKSAWWVVIRTKPRHTVDDRFSLEVAYQEDLSLQVNVITANDDDDSVMLGDQVDGYEEADEDEEEDTEQEDEVEVEDEDEDDEGDYEDDDDDDDEVNEDEEDEVNEDEEDEA